MSTSGNASTHHEFGRCDDDAPTCQYLEPCEESAVYVVPRPAMLRAAACPICAYHLALFGEDEPETYQTLRDSPDVADPERLADDEPWLSLQAAPASIKGLARLCLDGQGSVHYYELVEGEDGEVVRIVVFDGWLAVEDAFEYSSELVEAADWLAHVEEARGVLAVDDEHLARVDDEGGGGSGRH